MGMWSMWFGWLTDGKSGGPGAGQAGIIHPTFRWQAANLRQTLNEEAFADEFSECQQVSCLPLHLAY